jgi:hypothetical protein
MVRIQLDTAACSQLRGAIGMVELCDGAGRVIGHFVPEGVKHGRPPADLVMPLSVAEIERRRQARHGRTLDEILSGLAEESARPADSQGGMLSSGPLRQTRRYRR